MTKTKKDKGLCTLDTWESTNGELSLDMIKPWVDSKKFSHNKIQVMLEEFKLHMLANGNLYADFRAAFKVWVLKGYLGLTPDQLKVPASNPFGNVIYDKGSRL